MLQLPRTMLLTTGVKPGGRFWSGVSVYVWVQFLMSLPFCGAWNTVYMRFRASLTMFGCHVEFRTPHTCRKGFQMLGL